MEDKQMKKASYFSGIGLSQFFQLPVNIWITRVCPVFVLRIYLYCLGSFYFMMQGKDRIKIFSSLKYILHYRLTFVQFYLSVLKSYAGIFEHYLEKLLMGHRNFAKMHQFLGKRLKVQNRDILDQVAEEGKGGILVTGHYGAVEYLPLALSLSGYKIAMIVKFKTESLRKEAMKKAAEVDVEFIDADQDKVIYKALSAIKRGRFLITECDEFSQWIRHKKEKVSVFGNRVSQDKTLDFLYRRAQVPAMLGVMKRQNGGYVLSVDSLANGCEKVSLAKRAWNCLEEHILAEPYQWYQWKDAAVELAPFIENGRMNENYEHQNIPAGNTVLTRN
jgi:Kdo2-lipid IVA lauroyltransferase/acyltransferase